MRKKTYTIISTFAKDIISEKDFKEPQVRDGGPAFWIEKTLEDLGIIPLIVTSEKLAQVAIEVLNGNETGRIIEVGEIHLQKPLHSDVFIVSTIGNEFPLNDLAKLQGIVALDVQGYIRTTQGAMEIPKQVEEHIDIMKANRQEAESLPQDILERQKQKILLLTKGEEGFDVFSQGRQYSYPGSATVARHTIGAGDVLLAAFIVEYGEKQDPEAAGKFAREYVTHFLKERCS